MDLAFVDYSYPSLTFKLPISIIHKVTKTFTPPPPSNIGLSHGASYHYETFPALNFSKVGQTRKPMMWNQKHSSRESMRFKRSSSSSAKVEKTQQEIVKKAMWKNMSTTPGAIAAVARRSARDLETALAAMSPTMTSRKKIGSVLGSDTQKLKKKVEPSKPLDRMVNTLSRADTIMINTRRKQSILLDLVIKLQAMCRMFVKRTRFKKFRRSVVRLQNQHKRLSLTPKVEVDTNYFKMKVRKATIVQSYVRRFLADLEAKRRNKALCIIQRKGRGYLSLQKFTRMKMGVILIQRLIQARRTLFIFGLLKTMVSRVQARSRGILVRKRFALVFERRMSLYREQIFFLWEAANVSLSLRTKLWPTISTGQGFSRLWLAEAELSRLWSGLGIQLDTKAEAYTDESTRLGDLIGLDKSVYCMCNVSVKLLQSNSFPEGSHILGALQVVQAERLQIYERLDSSKSITDIGILYKGFDIPANEKLKKFCLANVMCKCTVGGGSSVKIVKLVLTLFFSILQGQNTTMLKTLFQQ